MATDFIQLAQNATGTVEAVPTEPVTAVPTVPLDVTQMPGTEAAYDFSLVGLFWQADIVVKVVIVMLILASFWSWAIIFTKIIRMRSLRGRAKQFEESFWSGGSLEELFDRLGNKPPDPLSSIFVAAMREWRRSAAKGLLTT